MKRCQADQVARLAEGFGPMVFATAYRILGNRDEANDAYQEVFLKLMKAKGIPIPEDRDEEWGAYLRVTATRCAIDILHRRPRWEPAGEELLENLAAPGGHDPHSMANRHQRAELLRQALQTLPEREARIFTLRHFEDLSYEKIAQAEQVSVGAVGVILHRVTQRLKKALESFITQDEPARVMERLPRPALSKEEDHG
jgi:RNA polymerase sigma factor (sigma-70 family)